MYLHLGQNAVVPEKDIIGIFDLDNTTSSKITREFLSSAEKAGSVINVSDELPNSFVLCDEGFSGINRENTQKMKIFLSQLSSLTLMKRSGAMRFE